jgi:hypothetical protein
MESNKPIVKQAAADAHWAAIRRCEDKIDNYHAMERFVMLQTGLLGGVGIGLYPRLRCILAATTLVPIGYALACNLQDRCEASRKILNYHKSQLERTFGFEISL